MVTSPGLPPGPHLDLLLEALEIEGQAQRSLLAGDQRASAIGFRAAADRYRDSYECAPPASHGRLIGWLKALVIAGDEAAAGQAATDVLRLVAGATPTPAASYVQALAALIGRQDELAQDHAAGMRVGGPAFERAADAIEAIARRAATQVEETLAAIVADFESREHHLTGVPIADTALMLQRLADERGLRVALRSPVLPRS